MFTKFRPPLLKPVASQPRCDDQEILSTVPSAKRRKIHGGDIAEVPARVPSQTPKTEASRQPLYEVRNTSHVLNSKLAQNIDDESYYNVLW